jgi:hypothetical protein
VNPNLGRALFAIALLSIAQPTSADVITDWNEKAVAFVQPRMPPPHGHRAMAMVHVAMFDAVNSIERRYRPYLSQLNATSTTSKEAAAAAAAASVLAALLPQARNAVTSGLADYLRSIPNGTPKTEGIALGEAVAAEILANRSDDGSDAWDDYRPRTTPGVYVPTGSTLASMWPNVRPFAVTSPAQFRPGPPPKLDSGQWVADYKEIKDLGSLSSSKRSLKQTEDARFWLITGPQAYFPIAQQFVSAKKISILEGARFMALASIAMSDSIIAVFDAKYHYEFWRPITAIRNGDLLKNSTIEREATWQPIDNTPMHPEYPCAHCIVAASFAAVVQEVLGKDVPEFSATSPTAPGVTHSWTDMHAFVNEVSQARIWAGFHYRFSTNVGEEMGYAVGGYVVKNSLQPVTQATR